MDQQAELCAGCGRSALEIAGWSASNAEDKQRVWGVLPERLAGLGVNSFRLSQDPQAIASFVVETVVSRAGVWSIAGGPEFAPAWFDTSSAGITVASVDAAITAVTDEAAVRIMKHDRVRIFGFSAERGSGVIEQVALVLPRGRALLAVHDQVTHCGTDTDAVRTADRDLELIDLGGGCDTARVCQRVARENTADADGHSGASGRGTQIAVSAVGRIETAQNLHGRPVPRAVRAMGTVPSAFAICAMFTPHDAEWLKAVLPAGG